MTGCQRFDEITLLRYISYATANTSLELGIRESIDQHIMECDDCAQTVSEMVRLSALLEAGKPLPLRLTNAIRLFARNGRISRVEAEGWNTRLVTAVSTREVSGAGEETRSLEIIWDDPPTVIRLIPSGEDRFWLAIESAGMTGKYVELRETGAEGPPVYMMKAPSETVIIKGLKPGMYFLRFSGRDMKLEIQLTNET